MPQNRTRSLRIRRPPGPSRVLNRERVSRDVLVIGASAGGVMALMELFAAFPPDIPASVGVVLHRSAAQKELAYVLGRRSRLQVIEPDGNLPLERGRIYLAPPDHHLLIDGEQIVIHRGPKEHSTRPAVDPLFRSAAVQYGRRVVGVLLTGGGEDGVSGLIAISKARGLTLAQDPEEAYMPSMPLNAVRYDEIDGVMGIKDLAPVLAALAHGRTVTVQSRPPRRP